MNIPQGDTPAPPEGAPPPESPPVEGFHPETMNQAPLNNSTGFAPDEINAPAPSGPSRWDVFMAKMKLAEIDSPTAALGRQLTEPSGPSQFEISKGGINPDFTTPAKPKLSPEEANQLYPHLPRPFSEPVDPDSAERIGAIQSRKDELQSVIAHGPELGRPLDAIIGGVAGGLAGIPLGGAAGMIGGAFAGTAFGAYGGGAGMIVGLSDPLNLALMAATGGLAKPIGVLAQNLLINAASTAASIPQRLKEREQINFKDEAFNVVAGAVGGTALHVAFKIAMKKYPSQARSFAERADPGTQQKMLATAIAQHESGSTVDMSADTFEMQRRSSGEIHGAPATYEFKPVDHPSERPYFVGHSAEHNTPVELDDMGPGVYATDNGQAANNLVSAPESPFTGTVHEVQVSEKTNFLDLDSPLPKPFIDQTLSELNKIGISEDLISRSQIESTPAREVMDLLKGIEPSPGEPSPLEVMRARVQAEGFDGYKYVHDDQGLQQNRVLVFDPKHLTPGEVFKANKDTTPRKSPEEAKAAAQQVDDPQRSRTYEPGLDQKIAQDQAKKPAGTDLSEEDARIQEYLSDSMAELKEMAKLDPTLLDDPVYKAFLHDATQAKQEAQVMHDFADCMVKGLI